MENNIKEPDMPLSPEELCRFCRGCAELLQNPVNATSVFNTFGRPEAEDPFSSEGFQREFARLFYGVGDETIPLIATPWSGLKVSDSASPMKQCADLYLFSDVKNTAPLPPDHLAVQLSFLAHLLSEGKSAKRLNFATRRSFPGSRALIQPLGKEAGTELSRFSFLRWRNF